MDKMNKKILGFSLGSLLLIIGLLIGGYFLLRDNDKVKTMGEEAELSGSEPATPDTRMDSDYLGSYTIDDTEYGTKVTVTVDEASDTRNIQRNALPNHETGEFPNSGNPNTISEQDLDETYPLTPKFVGNASFAQTVGIALNGVKLEPDTAERITCSTGETYNLEAKQDVTSLGLDLNNAHVQPTGEYHYHGASELLAELYATDQDLVHVAFAADGYQIYYSKSGAYKPSYEIGSGERAGSDCSYPAPPGSDADDLEFGSEKDGSLKQDWEFNQDIGDLDECNGIEVDGEYIYLMTDEYPFIGRCLNGEFTESRPGGPPPGQ